MNMNMATGNGLMTLESGADRGLATIPQRAMTKMCMADAKVRAWLERDDEGAVTAEYAVVLVAATAFAAVLIALLKSGEVKTLLLNIIKKALKVAA
ncbi:DUF4244 domain-containing protein [Bifidobacterium sp. ESL0790]|uniref:DUF4244 domain-containing protein n=1 Tax=Bifidobacterium sp. ESL0790 TaxID=2983233 RepID=UPI0023FA49CB|nr:DUF4244 domain-containing protein [Bifidobacterium sp. ESL0790]WEV72694.1 DUF4244 domain-containing protein [Bifidobacterium sp. ESL0790]